MLQVMLVEDDTTMLALLDTLLQMEGFKVVKAGEGEQEHLVELIREKKPDLVLLDVHLRKINGLELLRVIRATPDLKNTRILMSSGMDFRHECLQAGADDFMIKPYMPDDLIKKIRQTLQIPK